MTYSDLSSMRLLHLDDDPFYLEEARNLLESQSAKTGTFFQIESFCFADELLSRLNEAPPAQVVLLDHQLGDQADDGEILIKKIRSKYPQVLILMCSDLDDAKTIRECLKKGADDFLFKGSDGPAIAERILGLYKNSAAYAKLQGDHLKPGSKKNKEFEIIGNTMKKLAQRMPKILKSAISSIYIYGESGTGKEVVVDLLEQNLDSDTPLVRVHCGAISPNLLESELFGHVKGAFTGAHSNKVGLLEQAHGGWVFLDELATLPKAAQVALLRAIENQQIRPVGAAKDRRVSFNVIAATNEDLEDLVARDLFRLDLWQRLNEVTISLVPLRERMNEFEELVQHFAKKMKGGPYQVPASTMSLLKQYEWKHGNIRELRNCLRAMTESAINGVLSPRSIPGNVWDHIDRHQFDEAHVGDSSRQDEDDGRAAVKIALHHPIHFDATVNQLLLELIKYIFKQNGRLSLRQLAAELNLPRTTLTNRLRGLIQSGLCTSEELEPFVNLPRTF